MHNAIGVEDVAEFAQDPLPTLTLNARRLQCPVVMFVASALLAIIGMIRASRVPPRPSHWFRPNKKRVKRVRSRIYSKFAKAKELCKAGLRTAVFTYLIFPVAIVAVVVILLSAVVARVVRCCAATCSS